MIYQKNSLQFVYTGTKVHIRNGDLQWRAMVVLEVTNLYINEG